MTGPLETTLVLGRPVRYRVRRSPRARRIGVQVSSRDGLVVVLPRRAAKHEVARALEQWAAWIDVQVERHGVRHGPRRVELVTGSPLMVYGEPRTLVLRPLPPGRSRARVTLGDDTLTAELPAADLLAPRPVLERWLRREARRDLEAAHRPLGRHPGPAADRRWWWVSAPAAGAAARARGTLSFCYRLVMAPPRVIDAVVAHEVCHLAHLDHSRRFWALLDSACPWHRDANRWLVDHEDELAL